MATSSTAPATSRCCAKTTERFSLALVYGGGKGGGVEEDIADLLKNKKTVQKIYDANYQFPTPPDKPTLTARSGRPAGDPLLGPGRGGIDRSGAAHQGF